MSNPDEAVYPSGQPYSGTNRVPNIKQFVHGLDRDKKRRDAKIEQEQAQQEQQRQLQLNSQSGESIDHIPTTKSGKNRRTIRDPVTGKDVEIEDIGKEHVKTAEQRVYPLPFSSPSSGY